MDVLLRSVGIVNSCLPRAWSGVHHRMRPSQTRSFVYSA